jgi:hypothetical protein
MPQLEQSTGQITGHFLSLHVPLWRIFMAFIADAANSFTFSPVCSQDEILSPLLRGHRVQPVYNFLRSS